MQRDVTLQVRLSRNWKLGITKLKPFLSLAASLLCIGISWFVAVQVRIPPVYEGFSDDGHITSWLLLAPIPLEPNQHGNEAIALEQIPNEAKLRPKVGDSVKVGNRVLVWREYQT